MTEAAKEARARRSARRQGLQLLKSRANGTFMLVDERTNLMVSGDINQGYGLDLDHILGQLDD
jgi:hypothetical protein